MNPGRQDWVRHFLRVVSILLALTLSWLSRYTFDPDGVAYADIARAYLRGDWHNAFNTYWSPLYSWLLAIGFGVFHPGIGRETYIPHAIVFLGFLATLWSGEWLCREWERWQGPPAHRTLSTTAFYSLFMWAALRMAGMEFTSADIFLMAVWFLAAALLIRIRSGVGGAGDAVWLGLTLAFGFLAKGGFLAAIPCILAALVLLTGLRDRRTYLAAATTVCAMLPFVAAISITHGRFVITDAGWMNYSWLVSGTSVEGYKQNDSPPPMEIPHPLVRLLDDPRVLSYQGHLVGTIPAHSDVAWWSEGYPAPFDIEKQWAATSNAAVYTASRLIRSPASFFLLVCLLAGDARRIAREFTRLWFLWLPVVGMLCAYCLVFAMDRYLAPPLALLGFTMIAAAWKEPFQRRALAVMFAALIVVGAASVRYQLISPWLLWKEVTGARQPTDIGNVQIAEFLHSRSLAPPVGPRIGLIGSSIDVPWLELARGQIVAAVPGRLGNESRASGRPQTLSFEQVDRFWRGGPEAQRRVFAAMRAAGAEWVLADSVPAWADVTGWEVAGATFMFRPAGVQLPWCYARRL